MSPRPHSRITAVLFDAVGTLFRPQGSVGEIYSEVARKYGVHTSHEELDRRFDALIRSRGTPTTVQEWRALVTALFDGGSSFASFETFFREVYEVFRSGGPWRLFPETAFVLGRLHGNSYRLGVVTNFDDGIVSVLSDLGIADFFGIVQTPESSGWSKPDPRIFLSAAARLGCGASETLMVGDDPVQDFVAAQAAGMQALLVDRRSGAGPGAFVIADLGGILTHLGLTPSQRTGH